MSPITIQCGLKRALSPLLEGRKKQRIYYAYASNITFSQANTFPHTNEKENIRSHAYRRVQILYSQILFYYRENCTVSAKATMSQHGRATCPCCSAAHSAILPNLSDTKNLLHPDLQHYHNMNSTMELPLIVNHYDNILETHLRKVALEIINKASAGVIDPYKGLGQFVSQAQVVFKECENETNRKIQLLYKLKRLEERMMALESVRPQDPLLWTSIYLNIMRKIVDSRKIIRDSNQYSIVSKPYRYENDRETFMQTRADQVYSEIRKRLKTLSCLTPEKLLENKNLLVRSMKVIRYQKAGTVLPPFEYLSGVKVGVLRGMNESELLAQKSRLQKVTVI